MHTTNLILATIIAEDELESCLVADLKELGARGHTACRVRGQGDHGERVSVLIRGGVCHVETDRVEILN